MICVDQMVRIMSLLQLIYQARSPVAPYFQSERWYNSANSLNQTAMKRCPECRRDYYDDTLLYCLDDGTPLLDGPATACSSDDEPATVILSEPGEPTGVGTGFHASESPTKPQINTTDQTAILPTGIDLPPRKRNLSGGKLALGVGLVAILAVGGFFGYRYFGSNTKQIESIAVMPFVNESGNPDVEYLSDGMTETLINSLAHLPSLNVKARSTVFHYKGKDVSPQTVGNELSVQAILNGRVVQRGDQLTLSLELVDTKTGNQIWGEQYNQS